MKWILFALSLLWVTAGGWVILYTHPSRQRLKTLVERMGRLPLGIAAIVVGVLVIVAARGSYNAGFIAALGLLALIKGALFVWNPRDIYARAMQWSFTAASDQTYRLAGVILLVLGTALFSWIVH